MARSSQGESLFRVAGRRSLEQGDEIGVVLDARWQMIRSHKRNRFGRQQPYAIEFTAVQEHLTKARIVIGGGNHSTTTRQPFGLVRKVINNHGWSFTGSPIHLGLSNIAGLGLANG